MRNTDEPIIVEQTFDASIGKVWNAITKLDEMKQWFFKEIESFKPEVGFETQFVVQVDDRKFLHLWKLIEVIPMKKITYNWRYDHIPGDSLVMFELLEQNDQTKLKLTHEVIESFPEDIPEFSLESGIEGWTYFIKESLKEYLDKV